MAHENWIKWEGGKMPVDPDAYVEVEFDTSYWDGRAHSFDWEATDGIIAYRLVNGGAGQ